MAPGIRLRADSPRGREIRDVIREVIRKELDFEVEKGMDKDFNTTYTIHLTMNGERTGKYLCMQLTPGVCDEDDYELEVV